MSVWASTQTVTRYLARSQILKSHTQILSEKQPPSPYPHPLALAQTSWRPQEKSRAFRYLEPKTGQKGRFWMTLILRAEKHFKKPDQIWWPVQYGLGPLPPIGNSSAIQQKAESAKNLLALENYRTFSTRLWSPPNGVHIDAASGGYFLPGNERCAKDPVLPLRQNWSPEPVLQNWLRFNLKVAAL